MNKLIKFHHLTYATRLDMERWLNEEKGPCGCKVTQLDKYDPNMSEFMLCDYHEAFEEGALAQIEWDILADIGEPPKSSQPVKPLDDIDLDMVRLNEKLSRFMRMTEMIYGSVESFEKISRDSAGLLQPERRKLAMDCIGTAIKTLRVIYTRLNNVDTM